MALADPQSITISGTTIPLPRTGDKYTSADGLNVLDLSHAYGRRTRRVLRFDTAKIAANLYDPSTNVKQSASIYLVVDHPPVGIGYTQADLKALYLGYKGLITASSDAMIDKWLGGES